MIVAELERALLARYPKTDAEPWDHAGLSVGDPDDEIRGVAVRLTLPGTTCIALSRPVPTCC